MGRAWKSLLLLAACGAGLCALVLLWVGPARVWHRVERLRGEARRSLSGGPSGPELLRRVNEGHYRFRGDGALLWNGSYFGVAEPMDWSAYDYVEVTIFNPGQTILSFTFEVKDRGSDSYWTRVNQPQVLGPGLQKVKLPTRIRVGESARPGRPLDSAHVASLILARTDEKDLAEVEVRSIALKKADGPAVPLGGLAFDVGPEDTPVFDGFQALTEKSDYTAERGWGWTDKKLWSPYPQVNRLFGPERLTSDNLTISSARLRFDVKPGRYLVWMIIDHPGGFWGEYPYFRHRSVRAQGRLALDERQTPRQAQDAYFAWEDVEDREGDDLFERYWTRILREKQFEAQVGANGRLELDFENADCPKEISCFGMALSAVAILPVDSSGQRSAATQWIRLVHERRRAEFHDQFKEGSQGLAALLNALPGGLQLRLAPPRLDLSLAKPGDLVSAGQAGKVTQIDAFRNARALLAPVVSWKADKPREISWRIEGLPADFDVEGGWVRLRALRDSYGGNVYSIRERWVTDDAVRAFPFNDIGRIWLRFPIAKDARPGRYPATLVVRAAGTGETARLPLELHVLKGVAADLDFPVGPFSAHIQENWWDPKFLRPRWLALEEKSLRKLRELGMTSFSFSPRIGLRFQGDVPALDTSEVDRVMALAAKLGFQALVGYDGVFEGENLCGTGRGTPLGDATRMRAVIDAIEARSKLRHWLPLALVMCDEPVGEDIGKLATRFQDLGLADPRQLRRVQWSVTTSLGTHATPEDRKLVSELGLPFLNGFSREDLRFPWAYYNDVSRWTMGLRMFDLRQTSNLKYRLAWAWNVNTANPYFTFDGREDDIAWCSSLESAELRCSVELDREIDAGVTDYRIALAIKNAADSHPGARARGLKLLEKARAEGADPDVWRAEAGEYLETL